MIEIVFALIVGWALGIATAVLWPRETPPRILGGPPRVPTNLPQGTAATAPRKGVHVHFHGHPDDFEHFRRMMLEQQERQAQCPVT